VGEGGLSTAPCSLPTARLQVLVDEELEDADRAIFTQPIALEALGRFLIKLYRVSGAVASLLACRSV